MNMVDRTRASQPVDELRGHRWKTLK